MKILLLPGANPATIQWLSDLCDQLDLPAHDRETHSYSFLEKPDEPKSINHEVSLLNQSHYDLVIAKSLGSFILLQGLHERIISAERSLIFGVPLDIADDVGFDLAYFGAADHNNILFIQQINDKLGKADKLAAHVTRNLFTIQGKDHMYNSHHLFLKHISGWLK
ncbi:MAG: hypothetical protein D6B25_14145 [Desulfobulbaceae bacterium]|nr:MAG: hypothetical protein D6B25_14145 [Desulfobulbaceae bacterium]